MPITLNNTPVKTITYLVGRLPSKNKITRAVIIV